jgi:hypothetical protein
MRQLCGTGKVRKETSSTKLLEGNDLRLTCVQNLASPMSGLADYTTYIPKGGLESNVRLSIGDRMKLSWRMFPENNLSISLVLVRDPRPPELPALTDFSCESPPGPRNAD